MGTHIIHRDILAHFHYVCLTYWSAYLDDEKEVYIKALEDIKALKYNPFASSKEVIDEEYKKDFIKKCEIELELRDC